MGMFEQSLLLDHAAAKKTGALAVSLTVQTLFVGVLIALPLIYGDHLPDVRRLISLSLPLPPPPPPPVHEIAAASSSRSSFSQAKPYVPTRVPVFSPNAALDLVDAPPSLLTGSADIGVPGGTGVGSFTAQIPGEALPPPKPQVADTPKPPVKPTIVGGDVQAAKLLRKVIPVYPPLAKQARVSGTVQLIGVIAKDGTIQQLQVSSGHPLLVKAALDAVRQWVYRPTLLNGQAVEVIAPIDVIFTLSQ
jgi:protein TonB